MQSHCLPACQVERLKQQRIRQTMEAGRRDGEGEAAAGAVKVERFKPK